MPQQITTIELGVNCNLIKTGAGYILIDTGTSNKRAALEKKLQDLGCGPGDLKLIILTHGDIDHVGNSAYLHQKYGVKIAMHIADVEMVKRGDMSWNRKAKPDKVSLTFRILTSVMPLFLKMDKLETFTPDLTIDEDFNLKNYGLDARVVHLPGHSKGSIGILTAGGDLFCGDLMYNMLGFNYIDDLSDYKNSIEKLKKLNVKTIFPGHGKPFSIEQFRRKVR